MKTISITLLSLLLQFAAAPLHAQEKSGDKDIAVTLAPEKPAILLGEPVYVTLTIKNKSAKRVQLSASDDERLDAFVVDVKDAGGDSLPSQLRHGWSAISSMEYDTYIPAGGEYTFPLFIPTYARFEKPGDYTITVCANKTLRVLEKDKGIEIDGSYTTHLKVLPADPAKMGALIDDLGKRLIVVGNKTTSTGDVKAEIDEQEDGGGKAGDESNVRMRLWAIDDERVVPWYIQSLKCRNIQVVLQAISALGKFKSDAAFDALKAALKTTAADVRDASLINGNAEATADWVRRSAARSILTSPHPGAVDLVLALRNDPDPRLRGYAMSVMVQKTPHDQAVPILRDMAKDSDKQVSDSAKVYLRAWGQLQADDTSQTK